MERFVHLHLHSEFSLLDGACRIDRAVKHAKELGQPAIAITDHGVMYGVIDFYKKAKAQGIKPIIGCEVYVAQRTMKDKVHLIDSYPYHLVLLCKNSIGYQNLISLVSHGFTQGFYGKPRIDLDLLAEKSEGLICLSACLSGQIPRLLLDNDYKGAQQAALKFIDIFGAEDFYIEVQNHGIEEQQRILPLLKRLAMELGLKTVATNDAHYITKADSKMQHVLTCIQTNTTLENPSMEFSTNEFYMKSYSEMLAALPGFEAALDTTVEIAEKCNLEFTFGELKLPVYTTPNNQDNSSYFREKCLEGLYKNYGSNPKKEVLDRLWYEISVIEKMGYVDYYLIVHDFIAFAKSKGIPVGPGRGSGAGSLAAYCIGITGVDPIKYGLIFERFLNPERISMPDFDIDFCYVRRPEVIEYVVNRYGKDHVAQIITFGTMAARAAIRDSGRALGMSYPQVDTVAKLVPMELGITLEKALNNSKEFRGIYDNDKAAHDLIDVAKSLEGMPRHASVHAAGVVIAKEPVEHYVPLQNGEDAAITQFPMGTLEELGLLKMDFLGLRNLTVIADAEKAIRVHTPDFSIENISLEEKHVYQMFAKGQTEGVFQFESAGMKQVLVQLRPEHMEDLIAVISLYRPGPMDSIPLYIKNRHNPSLVKYKHPSLEKILKVTYGCIVYQEQVMEICRELAGFSYGRADLMRRAMSKKKSDVMEKERNHFIYGLKDENGKVECEGCIARGVSEKIAGEIFDEMSSFAAYAFNKSHAAAYSIIAYQTAYLKHFYPCEYMAALLTSVLDSTSKVVEYIAECNRLAIKILPPDVNLSLEEFSAQEAGVRFGLLAIKNLGRAVTKALIEERKRKGKFTDFEDFCSRMYGHDLRRKTLESLIKCGACDCFKVSRKGMLSGIDDLLADIERTSRANISGQINLFDDPNIVATGASTIKNLEEFEQSQLLKMERETIGLYVSGHPLLAYKEVIESQKTAKIADILASSEDITAKFKDGDAVKIAAVVSHKKLNVTKKGDTMAYLTLEDLTSTMETLVFSKILKDYTSLTEIDKLVMVQGRLSVREDEEPKLIADKIFDLATLGTANQQARTYAQQADSKEKKVKPGLYITLKNPNDPKWEEIKKYLKIFDGSTPVYIYFSEVKKLNIANRELWVSVNDTLISALKEEIGEKNVVFVK